MAKIIEQTITINVSKLVKTEDAETVTIVDAETLASLTEIVEQLVNNPAIVVELGTE